MQPDEYRKSEQALIRINIDDMLISLGWQNHSFARSLLGPIFRYPARQFARQVLDYDRGVQDLGLAGGARRLLAAYVKGFEVHGAENLPLSGPLLILSNHPGMVDTVALFAALPRPDLRVLAAERPFLAALPATRPYLFFVPENDGRSEVIRQTARYLRAGGAVLTFPGGHIDPDPRVMPGAAAALENWSPSTGIFVRLAPDLQVLPVIVSGVIAAPSLRHPLTRLRRQSDDRQRLAATLQILAKVFLPNLWPVHVQVDILPPIPGRELMADPDPQAITRAAIERIRPYYQRSDFVVP